MTDLDDLIARLRGFGPTSPASPAEVLAACHEAAAALASLRDENERLRKLVSPVALRQAEMQESIRRAALKHQ